MKRNTLVRNTLVRVGAAAVLVGLVGSVPMVVAAVTADHPTVQGATGAPIARQRLEAFAARDDVRKAIEAMGVDHGKAMEHIAEFPAEKVNLIVRQLDRGAGMQEMVIGVTWGMMFACWPSDSSC